MPIEALRRLVPAELEIDTFDGAAYVTLIPFSIEDSRPALVPQGLGMDFYETNVRTYVRKDGTPGIWFFSLDASSRLAVKAARLLLGLPYVDAFIAMEKFDGEISYRLTRRDAQHARHVVRYKPGELLGPSRPGTLEHFLLERYFLYTHHAGRMWRERVSHQPYPVQRAEILSLHDDLIEAGGLPKPSGEPLVHYASGVDSTIYTPTPASNA
jgi:uncharacterized protein YqjF (DUF2071 family)